MPQIGLWIRDNEGKEFIIKRDERGYPQLLALSQGSEPLSQKEEGRRLYGEVAGRPYPFPGATTRQVLWDLLELTMKDLP